MADFLIEDARAETLEEVETALIRLYRSLGVMFTSLDSKNIKSLTTDKTKISSENGCTSIDGAKLVMKDANGTTRLEIGEDDGTFKFLLKNRHGRTSLTLSSDGDAVFSGDISTEEDAYIGDNLYLGIGDTDDKEIRFYDGGNDDSKHVRIKAHKDAQGFATLRIIADKIALSTLSGVVDSVGNSFVTATPYSAYVTINGVDYPVNFR
ncbi:MAG: hypothetical protein IJT38_05700 [Clostridia bacterium]|nr:hypothetical protein [Clostridia bacterium]